MMINCCVLDSSLGLGLEGETDKKDMSGEMESGW